jgi:hypothetical protein
MQWEVEVLEVLSKEAKDLDLAVQDEFYAVMLLLQAFGPRLGRPHSGTLRGSRYKNLKELRFKAADKEWRAAYAFDSSRRAIILCIGSKSGISEDQFYRNLIARAELRFSEHLRKNHN